MEMLVPPWLEQFLSTTTFFSECEVHSEESRNECNMYCIDCGDKSFCFNCIESHDEHHRLIQIRRSSYHDVVRVLDIQNELDISGVQTYVINSYRVVFLNKRDLDQPKPTRGYKHSSQCDICQRNLVDPFRFCSLGCKFVWIMRTGRGSYVLSTEKKEEKKKMRREEEIASNSLPRELHERSPKRARRACSNSGKRKGIPRRAPFY